MSLRALTRATALVAEGLAEERLLPLLARCAAEAAGAELAAVYCPAGPAPGRGKPDWRLAALLAAADPEVLAALPRSYGEGGGILAPLFQSAREVCESDLLDGAPDDGTCPSQFPVRSLVGLPRAAPRQPTRRRAACSVRARADAFDEDSPDRWCARIGQLVGIGIDNARLAAGQQRERRMAAESAVTLGTVLESVEYRRLRGRAGRHRARGQQGLAGRCSA